MAEACNPPLSAAAGLDPSYCGVRRRDGGEEAALALRRRKMEKPNGGASGRMRRDWWGGGGKCGGASVPAHKGGIIPQMSRWRQRLRRGTGSLRI